MLTDILWPMLLEPSDELEIVTAAPETAVAAPNGADHPAVVPFEVNTYVLAPIASLPGAPPA